MSAAAPLASLDDVIAAARASWRPPPKLTLSEWADEHFYLSAENSAQPGRWKTLPYQVEPMNCMSDPLVEQVTLMKSARIGYTLMVSAALGYFVHQDPCSILFVQPTVEDAKAFSKETIATMIRDVPVLAAIMQDEVEERGARDAGNTIQGKSYPGGRLSLVGANSGGGFRRRSCRVAACDEVDGYPASAGSDGDPIKLAKKRTEYFWNRKLFLGSTPLVAGRSRIEAEFLRGDQRRYEVPCPHCGHFDYLVFSERDTGGHWLHWEKGRPETAHFVCSANGCVIDHSSKRDMVALGRWRPGKDKDGKPIPFAGHASFHIWAAYSFSPNATWAQIAKEFLEAKAAGREELRTFVNTTLGETWKESGDVPEWERLYARREDYKIGTVPDGVKFVTCGVDVQKDSWRYEVVGWSGREKESWSIEAGAIPGDTGNEDEWQKLDELLARTYANAAGVSYAIRMMGIDSGFNTNQVYAYARTRVGRVVAVKGVSSQHTLVGPPTPVDVTVRGKRLARGAKVWPVGVDGAKEELYAWLRLTIPIEGPLAGMPPPGWCHFPQYDAEYFRQLTAEHLVSSTDKQGYAQHEWQKITGRENHMLDCRVYARVAAAILGVDRMAADPGRVLARAPAPPAAPVVPAPAAAPPAAPPPRAAPQTKPPQRTLQINAFLGKRRGNWLKKR